MHHRARRILVALLLAGFTPLTLVTPAAGHAAHEGPVITFETPSAWFVGGLRDGITATATACAATGHIKEVIMEREDGHTTVTKGDAPCLQGTYTFDAQTPGTYLIDVYAVDSEGVWSYLAGDLRVEFLPFDTTLVEGFPRLEEMPECGLKAPGMSVAMEFILTPSGAVSGHRVAVGGEACSDTLADAPIHPEDLYAVVEFSRGAGGAHVQADNGKTYSGGLRQYDARWWHMVPLFQVWTPPEDLLASLP